MINRVINYGREYANPAQLDPYLNLKDNSREAMEFDPSVFGGNLIFYERMMNFMPQRTRAKTI